MGEALGIGFQCGQALNVRLNMCCFEFLRAFGARRVIIRFRSSGFAQTILDRSFGTRRSRPTPNLQPPTRNS